MRLKRAYERLFIYFKFLLVQKSLAVGTTVCSVCSACLFGLIKIKETLSPPQDKYEAFTRENEGKKNRPLNCYLFDFLCVPNKERCQAANMRINKAHTRT